MDKSIYGDLLFFNLWHLLFKSIAFFNASKLVIGSEIIFRCVRDISGIFEEVISKTGNFFGRVCKRSDLPKMVSLMLIDKEEEKTSILRSEPLLLNLRHFFDFGEKNPGTSLIM